MKKLLLTLFITLLFAKVLHSQCAPNCSLYTVASIPVSLSPNAGTGLFLGDDQVSGAVPIGFTFTFMCTAYTNLYVSSNGFLSFNAGVSNGCCSGLFCPTVGGNPNNYIAFAWNDLYPPGAGTIMYQTLGVAPNRIFVLTYSLIPFCCGGGPPNVSGQIKLYETTNVIEVHNAVVGNQGSNQTQGIMNLSGSAGFPAPGRNSTTWTANNDAYRWTVSGGAPAPISIAGPTSICIGSPNTYSVALLAGAVSYNWTLPGGWTGSSSTNTISATPGATGVLSVSATYTCGSSTTTTLSVTVNPLPIVSISGGTNTICGGYTVGLTANGASTYSWSNGGLTAMIAPSPTVSTTYSVIGTSVAGCTASASKNVTVTPAPVVAIAGPTQICIGQNVNLSASGASSYSWSTGALTASIVNTPTANITYTVIGTDAITTCTNSAVQSVTVNPLPVITIAGANTLCAGSPLNLTANGGNTYSWNTGQTTNTITTTPTANVTYTVFGTNTVTGCSNSTVKSITVNALPTVTLTGPGAMCLNQTITLNAYGAVTYSWSNGSTFSNIVVSPTANISYSVTGFSSLGCAGIPVVKNIIVNSIPTVSINATFTLICKGDAEVLTASGANTYSWSTGALTNSITITPSVSTSYTVTGTNTATGCYNTSTVTIQVSPCTGMAQTSNLNSQISVYPNPNNGAFTVELNNGLTKTIEVFDMMGRSISINSSDEDKVNINISSLSNGIYYIKIFSDSFIKVVKIIKQ